MNKVILLLFVFFGSTLLAQNEKIIISEIRMGKKVILEAENITADTLHIFLIIHATGYRRSADRPVPKILPPFSKESIITLIELDPEHANYTYEVIIKDEVTHGKDFVDKEDVIDVENFLKDKIVVF